MSRPAGSGASPGDKRHRRVDPTKQRKYESLAWGPYFTPVVDLATAYVNAAMDDPSGGAGADQMMISGPAQQMMRALGDEPVAEAARHMASQMMRTGRVMHWRGHNPLLADHVLGRA